MKRNSISIDVGGFLVGLVTIILLVIIPSVKRMQQMSNNEKKLIESAVKQFYEKAKAGKVISLSEYNSLLEITGRANEKYHIDIVVGKRIFIENSEEHTKYRFDYLNEIIEKMSKSGNYELTDRCVMYVRVIGNKGYSFVNGGIID